MSSLEYARPDTVQEVCSLLRETDDVTILAGGQSLLPLLRSGVASTKRVIDINSLDNQAYIERDGDMLSIGCLVRYADVTASDLIAETCPVLAEVAGIIGDMQVRNRGTLCGSLAHGDPAGDPPVLATLLDAEVVASSTDGTTTYDAGSFYEGFYETNLDEGEFVSEARFPVLDDRTGAAYEKWEAGEGAYPVATVGSLVEMNGEVVSRVRITTGAIEDKPYRMTEAESYLADLEPTEGILRETAELVGENTDPLNDSEGSAAFKTELVKTLAYRSLKRAVERSEGAN